MLFPQKSCKSICKNVEALSVFRLIKENETFEIDMDIASFLSFSSRAACTEKVGVFIGTRSETWDTN